MKQYIILLLALVFSVGAWAQTNTYSAREFELDGTIAGNNVYTARDIITLLPGFSFTAKTNMNFVGAIDDELLVDAGYATNPVDATRSLDKTLPVGTTQGSANVSGEGAAQYSIPILTSPGTAGMNPNLSITYNSFRQEGLLGKGWDLSGISKITRMGGNYYNDGYKTSVKLDIRDRFALDGSRLFIMPGASSMVYYRTEFESFREIRSFDSNGDFNPEWFEVRTKEGLTLEYGKTTDSRIEAQGKTVVLVWYLNKIIDNNGNYILFNYHEDNSKGEFWPKSIEYTGNADAGLSPYNKIDFIYEFKEDASNTFIAGTKVSNPVQLHKIKVFYEDEIFREYGFEYTYKHGSRLYQVTEKNGDGEYYNPIVIDWDLEDITLSEKAKDLGSIDNYTFQYGDFNGDGFKDYLRLNNISDRNSFNRWELYYYDGKTYVLSQQEDGITTTPDGRIVAVFSRKRVNVGDFNGDGLSDLLFVKDNPYNVDGKNYNPYLMLSENGNFETKYRDKDRFIRNDEGIYILDYDGNGMDDILTIRTDETQYTWKLFAYNTSSNEFDKLAQGTIARRITTDDEEDEILTEINNIGFDHNGDGKSDILIIDEQGSRVFEFARGGQLYEVYSYDGLANWLDNYTEPIVFGDSDILTCLLIINQIQDLDRKARSRIFA